MKINSEIGVYNLALNAVGELANVSSPTEPSRRAEVCRLWYELVRDQALEAAPWPEATSIKTLTLASVRDDDEWEVGEPAPGFMYSYVLPVDCLRPQYLTDFAPFELTTQGGVKLFHCNDINPILRYTANQPDVALWSNNLLMAVAYGLAGHISQPITGRTNQTANLIQRSNDYILAARVNSANQRNQQYESVPDWIVGRGYATPARQQFFYPMGSLLSVS